ncbi:MAG: hypothetical protein CR988_02925 [Treponema sp.]|nr:MAG: hypothetical protein CR988_02925 [Treponema sp.]
MNTKLIKVLIGVFALSFIVSCATTESKQDDSDPFMISLKNECETTNRSLPLEVAKGVQMDKMQVLPNRVLEFTMTMLDPDMIGIDSDLLKLAIKKEMLNDPEGFDDFIENDITLKYVIKDINEDIICDFVMEPKDFKNLK